MQNLKHHIKDLLLLAAGLGLLTLLFHEYFSFLDATSIAMLYLLAVLSSAYFSSFLVAFITSVFSFLLINYFFVEPKYTFQVGSMHSWLLLLTFLIVSFVVSTIIKQLKDQKLNAEKSSAQSQFLKSLAESLSEQKNSQALLDTGCALISSKLGRAVIIVRLTEDKQCILLSHAGVHKFIPNQPSLRWAVESSKMIGTGTKDWPDLQQWIMPFGRFQTPVCALVIDQPPIDAKEAELLFVTLICNQFATAYFRCLSQEQVQKSEIRAKEESFKKTLLASLSHDMRTPLTAILGSTNALLDSQLNLDEKQRLDLTYSIRFESEYLIRASENVLALVKLNTGSVDSSKMDWQLPEEIISAVVSRYKARVDGQPIAIKLSQTGLFIKADALLLAQALANLIDNAIKWHTGENPIEVCLYQENALLSIAVKNQGKGFPEGYAIENFGKTSSDGVLSRGFGLGLVIVKEIVNVHNGLLEIQSLPSVGATVTMRFPIVYVDETL
ncbi:MAG: DUF4118 domain-containing protein [Methylophilus sp.]|nr:DUF4118 domain-containing protein [Methylophilus sp.]